MSIETKNGRKSKPDLDTVKKVCCARKDLKYLNNPEVIDWLYGNPWKDIRSSKERQRLECDWGQKICGSKSVQWSTEFSESIFKDFLKLWGVVMLTTKYTDSDGKKLKPDFTTSKQIFELKARTWNTSGTAGEKILGVPFKYAELSRLSGKPVNVVLMGYQEEDSFGIFSTECEEKRKILKFYREQLNIRYVKFTDLLNSYVKRRG